MENCILLDAGSGGRASQRLINQLFLKYFDNEILRQFDDGAVLNSVKGRIVVSTDSYTVTPLFFKGGSIGKLAICGTVNDISMMGARPIALSCSFIIEEGLSLDILEKIVGDMKKELNKINISIVTGDTKVVPKGCADKLFINTTGFGEVYANPIPSGHNASHGDAVIVSGSVGDHGLAIMASRENLPFLSDVESDSAPLDRMVEKVISSVGEVKVLRDPTRGGLVTTLNEIAEQSNVEIVIDEKNIPIHENVKNGCSFLGLDPLYLANEGKCICIVQEKYSEKVLEVMKSFSEGKEASRIGTVYSGKSRVVLKTLIGGERILGMLEGAQLPRIC